MENVSPLLRIKKITEAMGVDYDSTMNKRVDLVLSMETNLGLESFLKSMQHYYYVLPPKDRNKLLELGEALEIQMHSRRDWRCRFSITS